MNTTKILGEAVGIQRQDIIDRTEEQTADGLTGAVILGRFKRGRVDAPMEIHQGNIRGQLGYDPKNPDCIAVHDCLDTDVPSVQVLRIGSNNNGGGGGNSPQPHHPISCAGATQEAILSGINIINGWTKPVTVDIYVNNILVATDITASYINQYWTSIDALKNNAETLGYYVSGDSSRQETFYNPSASNITFSFVPKSDGIYGGTTYFAKDALTISANNSNPTAFKDPVTGTLSFCLSG